MSDDEEYEYDYGSDAEYDYGSDQEDAEMAGDNDELIEIENSFYEGDDLKSEDPKKAIEMFEKVVDMETKRGDTVKWRFKALQHLVIIYLSLGSYEKMVERYRSMLLYISSVTRNECTEAINVILDNLAAATNVQVLSEMYEITLEALKTANNERLWFNTNLKLAKLYMDDRKLDDVERLISSLTETCKNEDGSEDSSKATYLMEIYCLEIQLCSITLDAARMRKVYPKTLHLNAAVADPRIMGIIREEGGKMQMSEGNWEDAYNEFYESFRNYQEAGNTRSRVILKYVVIASMLCLSDINPFDAREAKVYSDDKEIIAMSDLRQSLDSNDLKGFEKIVNNKRNGILDEEFLMTYIQPLRRRMREQALLNLLRPYKKVSVKFLAEELILTDKDVENLLVDMILDEKLSAKIDQTTGNVSLGTDEMTINKLYKSTLQWAEVVNKIAEDSISRLM